MLVTPPRPLGAISAQRSAIAAMPPNHQDLFYWLDSSSAQYLLNGSDTSPTDSDAIKTLLDKTSNAHDAEQSSGGARGNWDEDALNGLGGVVCDNTDDEYQITNPDAAGDVTTALTQTWLIKSAPDDGFETAMGYSNFSNGFFIQNRSGADIGKFQLLIYKSGNLSETVSGGDAVLFDGNDNIFTVRFDDGTVDAWLNGTKVIDGEAYTSDQNLSTTGTDVRVLRDIGGTFYESLMYPSALSDAQITELENYLSAKWAI